MTTVTSLTADRMLAIEAASVVDGDVIGGNLILTKHDGSQINAGNVTGPTGSPGPVGQDLPILSAVPVLDVGLVNQIRAGRQLTAADFTNMGLSAPLGLWNLSDLTDVSGNGRNLLNKGAVPFDVGINGAAATSAKFVGSTAQALYIPDTGAADPFRIKTGSFGCWFKTAQTSSGIQQSLISKRLTTWAPANVSYYMFVASTIVTYFSDGATNWGISGTAVVADDRWHFAVTTFDATGVRIYVDGILDANFAFLGFINTVGAPFNIGANSADGSIAANNPHSGRIDEAFITADILTEDQVRNLYCVKIPHTLAAVPSRASLNVHRRRKGATLTVADFPTQPLRLYNFSGGSLGDEGSNGTALINNGATPTTIGSDGSSGNAYYFNGAMSLSATDAGLPSGLAPRSFGAWFKSGYVGVSLYQTVCGWGTSTNVNETLILINGNGNMMSVNGPNNTTGPFVADGLWHFAVQVEDNTSADIVKAKQYVDGKVVAVMGTLASTLLGGANHFRIGSTPTSDTYFVGSIDGVFVCDYALTSEQIAKLYAKGSQALASSPKNVGDHVEAMSTSNLLATFDTLESQHIIDLTVAP